MLRNPSKALLLDTTKETIKLLHLETNMLKFATVFAACVIAYIAYGQVLDPPPTVDEFDVTKYLGRWFQAYANILVLEGQNRGDPYCVHADYELCNSSSITLVNRQYLYSPGPDGEEYNISGVAYFTDEIGKLVVYFPSVEGQGDYWIMQLGPETFGEDELYQYSLVSNPSRTFNYVLVRDVEYFNDNYYDEVFEWLEQNGFNTTLTELLPSYQGDPCYYPEYREPELPADIICDA